MGELYETSLEKHKELNKIVKIAEESL